MHPTLAVRSVRGAPSWFFAVSPQEEDDRPVDRATVRRVIATFRPYRRKVAVVGLAIVVTATLGVVNPLLIKAIFDNALFGDPAGDCAGSPCPQMHTLYVYVALMIVIPIVTGVPSASARPTSPTSSACG